MATYGLGSAWSKASENQAVNQFAAASAARDRSLTDEYHRAKARENLMRLQEEGRVDMDSREANAYLENDYLRSKTGGAAGLNPAQFNQYALQGTGLADEAKAVVSGVPLKNYTQGKWDVSQHVTRNEAGELGIGDKPNESMQFRALELQKQKAAQDLKNKKSGKGDGVEPFGYTSDETTSKVDDALMKAVAHAASPSETADERVQKATALAELLDMDDEPAAKFIAEMYSNESMSKADIIGYISESGLAKNDQEYESLMDSLGVTKRKKFQIKRDGKDIAPVNGFTIDGIDYGSIQTNDGNRKVLQMSKLADAMTNTGGSVDEIAEQDISKFSSELSSYANTEDVENFNNFLMTPGTPLSAIYDQTELDNPFMQAYVDEFSQLKESVFQNGAWSILNNIQDVEGATYFGAFQKELKDGVEKHLIVDGQNKLVGPLAEGQSILSNITSELKKELEASSAYDEAPTLVKNEIYKTEFMNRTRTTILDKNMKENKFFRDSHNKSRSVVTELSQMEALPKDAQLSTGNSVVYKALQFDPYRLKAVITNKAGKKTTKIIDIRTKEKMRKSIYDFYKTVYDDNGQGHSKFMMNKFDKKGWPDGTMEEHYTKTR